MVQHRHVVWAQGDHREGLVQATVSGVKAAKGGVTFFHDYF